MNEELSSIEVGVMTHEDTGERRIGITLSNGTMILLNAEQADAVINSLNEAVADIKAKPYRAVGTIQ